MFPVLPLSGLTEAPQKRAVLLDITCDSDGAMEHYVDGQGIESTLPVPAFSEEKPYLMGFFLVGAYQEILGDMHNLFGDTHSAIIKMDEQGQAQITEVNEGDTVADMMRYVHLDVESFQQSYAQLVAAKLPETEQQSVLDELQTGLNGYTYLEEL